MIGIAITSARATGLQWRRSSSRSTNIPSEKRVRISASSISSTIDWSRGVDVTTPVAASAMPSATERTEAERTVPRITPGERRDDRPAVHRRAGPLRRSRCPSPGTRRRRAGSRSTSSSAIWTALVAAPLRRLSETIQRSIARSLPGSRRMRPTKTSSRPAASIAIGYAAAAGVVDDGHAGRRGEQLARALRGELVAGLDVDGLRVAGDDRDPDAGGADPDRGVTEDLAGLVDQLALLVGVVVAVGEAARLRQDVEGDLVRVDVADGVAPVEHRPRLLQQLVDRRLAGPRDGLVGRDHQPLDPGLVLERLERDDHLHRRAVRVGDDPPVALGGVGIHLGDDERHVVVHPEVAGVVDDHGARLDEARRPLGADRPAGRGEDQVEALDRVLAQPAADELGAVPLDLAAGGALGGEGDDLRRRETRDRRAARGSSSRPARSRPELRLCIRRRHLGQYDPALRG